MGQEIVDIGTVVGFELAPNKDGDDNVRLLQVEFSNPDDIQTVEQFRAPGLDCNPQVGARVITLDLGAAYRVGICFDDGVEPAQDPGGFEAYAFDDSFAKMAWILLGADETVTIANASGSVSIAADGSIKAENGSGSFELKSSGQFDANGNFTVDP